MRGGEELVAGPECLRLEDGVHRMSGAGHEGEVGRVGMQKAGEAGFGGGEEGVVAAEEEVGGAAFDFEPESRLGIEDGAGTCARGTVVEVDDVGAEEPFGK